VTGFWDVANVTDLLLQFIVAAVNLYMQNIIAIQFVFTIISRYYIDVFIARMDRLKCMYIAMAILKGLG
jgi:hypothetical protein